MYRVIEDEERDPTVGVELYEGYTVPSESAGWLKALMKARELHLVTDMNEGMRAPARSRR